MHAPIPSFHYACLLVNVKLPSHSHLRPVRSFLVQWCGPDDHVHTWVMDFDQDVKMAPQCCCFLSRLETANEPSLLSRAACLLPFSHLNQPGRNSLGEGKWGRREEEPSPSCPLVSNRRLIFRTYPSVENTNKRTPYATQILILHSPSVRMLRNCRPLVFKI